MKRVLRPWVVFALLFSFSGVASAGSERMMTYRYSQIWRTAVRLIRVDQRLPIVEKDQKDGYVLFEYRDQGRTYHGSFELVATVKDGKHFTRVAFRIQDKPTYVAGVLLGKLKLKLRQEYGIEPAARLVEAKPTKASKNSKKKKSAQTDESESEETEETAEKEAEKE